MQSIGSETLFASAVFILRATTSDGGATALNTRSFFPEFIYYARSVYCLMCAMTFDQYIVCDFLNSAVTSAFTSAYQAQRINLFSYLFTYNQPTQLQKIPCFIFDDILVCVHSKASDSFSSHLINPRVSPSIADPSPMSFITFTDMFYALNAVFTTSPLSLRSLILELTQSIYVCNKPLSLSSELQPHRPYLGRSKCKTFGCLSWS